MQSFIENVVADILAEKIDLQNAKFIFSSKRATIFFKETFKKQIKKTSFLPQLISIEDFISEVADYEIIDNTELLFLFYQIYLETVTKDKADSFDKFISWSTIVLQDFNELDRYLIDANYIFNYLSDIKRLEEWFKDKKITELSKNYVNYFKNIGKYYQLLGKKLTTLKSAYQGFVYKKAYENITEYIKNKPNETFVFIGLNALNKAEESIIKELLLHKKAKIYFDFDSYLFAQNLPYAKFIKKYKNNWKYFDLEPFKFLTNDYISDKNIEVIGVPKNVSQIKYASQIIQNISKKSNNFTNTAYVLANENLLPVALNSLPNEVERVNITMGYALKNISLSNLFLLFFKAHQNKAKIGKNTKFYYKDVISILNFPIIKDYFFENDEKINDLINKKITEKNINFLTSKQIIKLFENPKNSLFAEIIFQAFENSILYIRRILYTLDILLNANTNHLETEYLIRFTQLFQQLENLETNYHYLENLNSLESVFKQLLSLENLSFQGEPLSGLQIMGMLETRSLDFENIIITSVNEGFLPGGKIANSFIPFDVKNEFGLPTYKEKDAIFSYHFFRLLQRAKNIYLLYNTETDDFGSSEKSRFITQLEILSKNQKNHNFTHKIVSPNAPTQHKRLLEIKKDSSVLKKLSQINEKGFSPSTLTNYIVNPIYFYKQRILGIKPINELEETVAINTFGTVIHDTLEYFYKPFINIVLTEADIRKMKKECTKVTKIFFEKNYINGDITKGKNLLSFELAVHYIQLFLNQELQQIKQGNEIVILELESKLETEILINKTANSIKIRGLVDRIDRYNGTIRIIDYKTGRVEQKNLDIKNWELLTSDYKFSKSFQVLFYAYIYVKTNKINLNRISLESGIISFKNLKSGFMKVNKNTISNIELDTFKEQLTLLLDEIYDIDFPFIETENPAY